jgi:hypothetical protein
VLQFGFQRQRRSARYPSLRLKNGSARDDADGILLVRIQLHDDPGTSQFQNLMVVAVGLNGVVKLAQKV